ncbi:glyoxalase domain-containing protein 4-like isoform X1 [Leptotrombidium deliense]|uniref:Glyoxalase domain-containing protein 4-like isoform X1 n=1 Tax=Leptotrombidium deliense TaxID=299467 RepID=A0A443SCX6_9ACAR|nr:glyoxalase domain-containing protein 4-like isoform X1 [Leptotrombidium deliense]
MATRTLHWCFKIGKRKKSIYFYKDVLQMTPLRHEENDKGCEATCNGPYNNKWSKTMIGYGPEDNNFVFELTYNYPIKSYAIGNDFRYVEIESTKALNNIKSLNWQNKVIENGLLEVCDPDGYVFRIKEGENKVTKLALNVESLQKSLDYWVNVLQMKVYNKTNNTALLGFGDDHCKLELNEIGTKIDHRTAWGRIAFSRPLNDIRKLNEIVNEKKLPILHKMIELGTPGKATVAVVIFLDPDGYEICFVGDENYTLLCTVDPKADTLLQKALETDPTDIA